jgi:hypothetical protein
MMLCTATLQTIMPLGGWVSVFGGEFVLPGVRQALAASARATPVLPPRRSQL